MPPRGNEDAAYDKRRRAAKVRGQEVIDLTGKVAKMKVDNRFYKGQEFSTPFGNRTLELKLMTRNYSNEAITLKERWSHGTFRWAHKGQYTKGGPQEGNLCVLKEFIDGCVFEESFFACDLKNIEKARTIIDSFNDFNRSIGLSKSSSRKVVKLVQPDIWCQSVKGRRKKKLLLVEPMLEGKWIKFNSNGGYVNSRAEFMQALSHYSYHCTSGKYLLCDLQGCHYMDAYVLTDPVIMSRDSAKRYGPTDLGREGILNFFARHECNRFCQSNWKHPQRPQVSKRIRAVKKTTMSLEIGRGGNEDERQKKLDAILAAKRRR